MTLILYYLLAINVVSFCLYGIDKYKAVKNKWRIPEATLLGVALVGGSVGAWAGMQVFRHKTKHWQFKILVPAFLILQVVVFVYFGMN